MLGPVEFAIMVPVMILIILGGFDIGMEMLIEQQLTFASESAALQVAGGNAGLALHPYAPRQCRWPDCPRQFRDRATAAVPDGARRPARDRSARLPRVMLGTGPAPMWGGA